MELNIDLGTLAKAAGGKVLKGSPSAPFNAFVTDTRKLKCGEFFWALKGAAFDANDLLADSVPCASGFVAREDALLALRELPPAAVGVRDTLKALQDLAAWHRRRWQLPLVATTGSNGKSTTKEMLRSIFAAAAPIRGRLVRSRSPPQPNTTHNLPSAGVIAFRTAIKTFRRESSLWA